MSKIPIKMCKKSQLKMTVIIKFNNKRDRRRNPSTGLKMMDCIDYKSLIWILNQKAIN